MQEVTQEQVRAMIRVLIQDLLGAIALLVMTAAALLRIGKIKAAFTFVKYAAILFYLNFYTKYPSTMTDIVKMAGYVLLKEVS